MKLSPLHLTDYFITELHFTANAKFDQKQEVKIQPDDFQIAVEAQPAAGLSARSGARLARGLVPPPVPYTTLTLPRGHPA